MPKSETLEAASMDDAEKLSRTASYQRLLQVHLLTALAKRARNKPPLLGASAPHQARKLRVDGLAGRFKNQAAD